MSKIFVTRKLFSVQLRVSSLVIVSTVFVLTLSDIYEYRYYVNHVCINIFKEKKKKNSVLAITREQSRRMLLLKIKRPDESNIASLAKRS
jgi:hypothetical protein